MQHFVAGPYSGKVIKTHRCIFLGSKDMRKKADWGGNFTPPPLDIAGLKMVHFVLSYNLIKI